MTIRASWWKPMSDQTADGVSVIPETGARTGEQAAKS